MTLKTSLAILAGKLTLHATRFANLGGGTAAPGLMAEAIDPNILAHLAPNLSDGAILVSGTNGKTTTSRLLSQILKLKGTKIIHNRAGSNLTRGIASTLIEHTSFTGKLPAEIGLFEVDEAALSEAAAQIKPRLVVLTNLFRDQLDRYFELDQIVKRWHKVLSHLPKNAIVCLNADDPRVASLGQFAPGKVFYFGIASANDRLKELPQAADVTRCPQCGGPISYSQLYSSHQGDWKCNSCKFQRPALDVSASGIALNGTKGLRFVLSTHSGKANIRLNLPGFYNAYNALSAATAAIARGVDLTSIQRGLEETKGAFGRVEEIAVGEKKVILILVKNPTGFNEVLRMVGDLRSSPLLLALNDHLADGRDVSWIWDVDLERFKGHRGPFIVSGTRAWDLANRLKYAGISPGRISVQPNFRAAVSEAIKKTPAKGTLYLLPTYTALFETRKIFEKMGSAKKFWEE